MDKEVKFSTLALQSVRPPHTRIKPISPPIHLSTTYERNSDGTYDEGYVYARNDNPNRRLLEQSAAQLEGGAVAYAFASGMAAIHTILQALRPGEEVLLPEDVYYNVRLLFKEVFEHWQLKMAVADFTDLNKVEVAIQPNTRLIWIETPSNPQLQITNIQSIARIAHQKNCLVAVDNTWATPVLQRPLDLGADMVMHATTKYFGGHSDVLSGLIILKEQNDFSEQIHRLQKLSGAVPSPFDCWLVTRGIQTLSLRVKAQSETAFALARFLDQHEAIERVHYPGLATHPQHEIAMQQMKNGFGGMLSVLTKGDARTIANRLQLFTAATSLGGVESLVEHRRSVEGEGSKSPENLLRLSVGLEAFEDLKWDWERGLDEK